jgi:hypothetical protein
VSDLLVLLRFTTVLNFHSGHSMGVSLGQGVFKLLEICITFVMIFIILGVHCLKLNTEPCLF